MSEIIFQEQMAIYIDSAKVEEARSALENGWVYGITTNPSLLAQSGLEALQTYRELSKLPTAEIYYQVSSDDMAEMHRELGIIEQVLGDKLVVKIPPTPAGFRFAAEISAEYKTCLTAIFSPAQALAAAECNTDYIAIYVNRATRFLGDGNELVTESAIVLQGSKTKILAASLKTPQEAASAVLAGADHITLPYQVLNSLTDNEFSAQAVDQFNQTGSYI